MKGIVAGGYNDVISKLVASGDLRTGIEVELVYENNNPYDKNAVRIEKGGVTIGYLPRETVAQRDTWQSVPKAFVSNILGGYNNKSFGIVIALEITK